MRIDDCGQKASPARLLEMLSDRFGAFEAVAHSSIKLARHVPEPDCRWTCSSRRLCWNLEMI